MNEKALMVLGTIGGIISILPIIAWFIGGKELQGNNRETLRTMANFEILVILIGVLINFIPFVGHFISVAVMITNIVIAIKAYCAIDKESLKLPVAEIIK